jgi:DNA-binding response OmpR family regulator
MVVDDNPLNLRVIENMLEPLGYDVRSFPRGRLALAAAARSAPDLVLLDINMPEMDGFAVCRQLRENPETSEIPVIVLSALDQLEDKLQAFRCGAQDYLTKPLQLEEVEVRVRTHLRLAQLQRGLRERNEQLEAVVAERTRQLVEANRKLRNLDCAKSEFLRLISHELRTPLHCLFGIGELMGGKGSPLQENDELREMFADSSRRIQSIVDDALLLTELEVAAHRYGAEDVALDPILAAAKTNASVLAAFRGVNLGWWPETRATVTANPELLRRALEALAETAVKFTKEGGTVGLHSRAGPEATVIHFEGVGSTIPENALPRFFDVLAIGEAITPGGDLGLAAPLAHRILVLFGGSASVENIGQHGIRLTASLPRAWPEPGLGDSR